MVLLAFEEFFYPEQVIESVQIVFRSERQRRKSCPVIGQPEAVTWGKVKDQYRLVSALSLFADVEEVVPYRKKALKMWTLYAQMSCGNLADGVVRRTSV